MGQARIRTGSPVGDRHLAFAMERTTGLELATFGYEHAAMAHPNSMTPKRSRRVKVTRAETSNEPPQPSLLEKKMNKAATGPGEAPYIERALQGHQVGLGVAVSILFVGLA